MSATDARPGVANELQVSGKCEGPGTVVGTGAVDRELG
jgi:hypothetical protein